MNSRQMWMMVLVALGVLVPVSAQKTFDDAILIATLPGITQMQLRGEHSVFSPMLLMKANTLVVPLGVQRKIFVYNSRFEFEREIVALEDQTTFSGAFNNFNSAYYGHSLGITVMVNNNVIFPKNIYYDSPAWQGIFKDLVILVVGDGVAGGYLLPKTVQGTATTLSRDQVFQFIRERGPEYQLQIEDDYLLYRGVPWYDYGFRRKWKRDNIGHYASIDKDANIYHISSVYNSTGMELESFSLWDSNFDRVFYDYECNVYIIKNLNIYYIGRDWGYPDARAGNLQGNTAVYLHPGSIELVIGQASSGALTVFEQTQAVVTINGKSAPWYKVKTSAGLIGWVHGGGITYKQVPNSPLKEFTQK